MNSMPIVLKSVITLAVIIALAQVGKRFPGLGGLIAAMPLTTLLVMVWIYSEKPDHEIMMRYVRGVLWGIIPTAMFFGAAYFCLWRKAGMTVAIGAGFAVWLIGAAVHQYFLGR